MARAAVRALTGLEDTPPPAPSRLDELREAWAALSPDARIARFRALPHAEAEELFLALDAHDHANLILGVPPNERRAWMRALEPDDAADVIQEAPADQRDALLSLLDEATRKEVGALLAYAEDDAGGLMNPRFARLRPDMGVDEAISYLRRQARERKVYSTYVYVLDAEQRLLGVTSLRGLFGAQPNQHVRDVMHADAERVPEFMDQELVSQRFRETGLLALPVVDADGRMKGVVTVDDIVHVVQEEATEDIQKFGGVSAIEAPYLDVGLLELVRKRAGWLAALFVGEMLTASTMAGYADEIANAVVLTLFLPLIIASGGNSGSQASTLVIRAMALDELKLRDWWRVVRREVAAGLMLGAVLGGIGVARVFLWEQLFGSYGAQFVGLGLTVGISLVGVVLFGTIAGSMLPFVLRRLGLDPASASAPFVATLVDVMGLVIYFGSASVLMGL